MAKQLQLRRGTTAQHSTFTGAVGEVTIDTDKDVVVVHDGATAGGFPSQKELVSGTNIKTVNSTTLLGSGDIAVQPTLVSGTNIKTVNSTTLLGSGNIAVQETLVSGTNIKSINSSSILASGNLDLVAKVSSTDNAIVRFDGTSGAVQNSSVFIDDSGNVGIGTSSPSYKQTIASGNTGSDRALSINPVYNSTVNMSAHNNDISGTKYIRPLNIEGEYLTFSSGSSTGLGGGTERMRIDSSGNVGIGTSYPGSLLNIRGGGATWYPSMRNINQYIESSNSATSGNTYSSLAFGGIYTGVSYTTFSGIKAGKENATDGNYGGFLSFNTRTNGSSDVAERMRIDSSGNVGIGVTPSTWGVGKAIDLANSGSVYGDGVNQGWFVGLSQNAYWSAGTTWRYRNSGITAGRYEIQNNTHNWYTAPSGTAGNAITWAQAMTLNSSGDLIVGTNNQISGVGLTTGGGASVTSSASYFGKNTSTNRSINAGGTINASGADYAEYEHNNGLVIAKGSIVGFKADGTLTDKYSESIRFAIKSTNPSYVGGDTWGSEDIVGKKPEQPTRLADETEQKLVSDAVKAVAEVLDEDGSIITPSVEAKEAVYETVITKAGDTDAEWEAKEAQYKIDLADFKARLEAERIKVDRIAYSGKVPVNVLGAVAGQYVCVKVNDDDSIGYELVNKADMTFEQYQDAVGRVNKILEDGRAEVAVIVH